MKRFIMLIPAALLVIACGGQTEEPAANADTAHNARNSLDYHGIYTGTLPCADCEGIETTIMLEMTGVFFRNTRYLGKEEDNLFAETGTYLWNEAGNTIQLEGARTPNRYFVGENVLFHLDMDGNRITGGLADNYQLMKAEAR